MDGNPDSIRLVNQLDRTKTGAWDELHTVMEEMTDEDREVNWKGGGKRSDGTYGLNYPTHSDRVNKAMKLLSTVGAVTPRYLWMDDGKPKYSSDSALSVADAIRAATFVVRSERFNDAAIADAVKSGTLDAILKTLITWYDEA